MRGGLGCNRARALELAGYVSLLVVLAASSTPRRVGDGLEYIAAALNISEGRPPGLNADDRQRLASAVGRWADMPPIDAYDWPSLVGPDGRQDAPHVFLYSAVVAPFVRVAMASGLHPNHAFTFVNVLCLAGAWLIARRHASLALTVLICVSPVVWWVDKAHTEVFVFALLLAAFGLARAGRGSALVAIGLAAAQNPGLLIVWPSVVAEAWRHRPPARPASRFWTVGALGACPVLAVAAYNWSRHGTPTLLADWTVARIPTAREWLAPILDLNTGLLPNAPLLALLGIAAVVHVAGAVAKKTVRQARPAVLHATMSGAMSAVATALVLTVVSQSTNLNHGGTPGLSRYALWLIPLAWPVLLELDARLGAAAIERPAAAGARASSRRLVALAAASAAASVVVFHPSRPEVYRYPSKLSGWAWTMWPSLENPPAEVFAERVSHLEPPLLPAATDGCAKVLVFEGQWPVPCLPRPTPEVCWATARLCYANSSRGETRFVVLPPPAFPYARSPRRWSENDAFMPALARLLRDFGDDTIRRSPGEPGSAVRGTEGVDWLWTLQGERKLFVFLPSPARGGAVTLRTGAGWTGALINLSANLVVSPLTGPDEAGEAWLVDLPASTDTFAIVLSSGPSTERGVDAPTGR